MPSWTRGAVAQGSGAEVLGDPAGKRGKPGTGYGYGVGLRVDSPLGPLRFVRTHARTHACVHACLHALRRARAHPGRRAARRSSPGTTSAGASTTSGSATASRRRGRVQRTPSKISLGLPTTWRHNVRLLPIWRPACGAWASSLSPGPPEGRDRPRPGVVNALVRARPRWRAADRLPSGARPGAAEWAEAALT
eukprot:scaffold855_cov344-Prasinococcus_capsulatus_cf.AAC.6